MYLEELKRRIFSFLNPVLVFKLLILLKKEKTRKHAEIHQGTSEIFG